MSDSIDVESIDKAIQVAIETMKKHGVEATIEIVHVSKFKPGNLELIKMFGNLIYGEAIGSFDFYIVAPLPSHRTLNDWVWIIAYFYSGGAFQFLRKQFSNDLAQSYSKKSADFVDELIHRNN